MLFGFIGVALFSGESLLKFLLKLRFERMARELRAKVKDLSNIKLSYKILFFMYTFIKRKIIFDKANLRIFMSCRQPQQTL